MFLYELFQNNFEILTTEFFLTLIILILLLFGTYLVNSDKNCNQIPIILMNTIVIYFLFSSLFLIMNTLPITVVLLNGVFLSDEFIQNIHLSLIVLTIFFFFIQKNYILHNNLIKFENTILILLSLFGLFILTSSYNFITLYLAIEIQSLCFYILSASRTQSIFSIEAGLKYFILGALSSGFILYGSSIIYLATGSLNFSNISLILSNINLCIDSAYYPIITYGLMFILAGLLFKLGAVPFHSWLPDVYEGTPTNITAFFAIIPKLAICSIMFRLFFDTFYEIMTLFEIVFSISAFFSIFIGSIVALSQINLKRLFAYSTIGHTGFLLVGFASNTLNDIKYILFYLLVYILMSINIWTILIGLTSRYNSLCYLTDLTGLLKRNPGLAILFMITLFSMAGIPPLLGFFSKMFVFFMAIHSNLNSLALLNVLISVISIFYYVKLIKIINFDYKLNGVLLDSLTKSNSYIISTCSLCLIFLPFFLNLVLNYIEQITLTLIF